MTYREFDLWFRTALKGAQLIYHSGFLAIARGEGQARTAEQHKTRVLGDEIYRAYENGHVTLVQRRLRPMHFDYIAIKL